MCIRDRLREGLDLPEVSLVAIIDADKEGFLRSDRALIQTAGRAARNINSQIILYADRVTGSMQRMLEETGRRRALQIAYNEAHNITPRTVRKDEQDIRRGTVIAEEHQDARSASRHVDDRALQQAAYLDPLLKMLTDDEKKKLIAQMRTEMLEAAENMDYERAATLRDNIAMAEATLTTEEPALDA